MGDLLTRHLGNWLTKGYELQFQRQPPAAGWVVMTIIRDLVKAQALVWELCTFLEKGAITQVDLVHPDPLRPKQESAQRLAGLQLSSA